MILKPPSCEGCPFHATSKYFVPDRLRPASQRAVVAQNPGKNEERGKKIIDYQWFNHKKHPTLIDVHPQPLIGATGYALRHDFWPLTRLGSLDDVSLMNIIKCRPYGKDTLPDIHNKALRGAVKHCMTQHFHMPTAVKHVLSLGQVSLWALTRQLGLLAAGKQHQHSGWRGYALPLVQPAVGDISQLHPTSQAYYFDVLKHSGAVVMPTLHIAALFKGQYDTGDDTPSVASGGNKRYFHAVKADFQKFGKLTRGQWPEALPEIIYNHVPRTWPALAAFDTEYHPETGELIMWSLTDVHGKTYVVDAAASSHIPGSASITIVGQNLLADLKYLHRMMDVRSIKDVQDTMLAHSVLWTGEPHSLDYILSLYGSLNRHKHLAATEDKGTAVLYAGLDSYTTLMDAWRGMLKEFKIDPQSWHVYRRYTLPLLKIINTTQDRGIKVDQQRLALVTEIFSQRLTTLREQAAALTGKDTFNLGSSQQMAEVVYGS